MNLPVSIREYELNGGNVSYRRYSMRLTNSFKGSVVVFLSGSTACLSHIVHGGVMICRELPKEYLLKIKPVTKGGI